MTATGVGHVVRVFLLPGVLPTGYCEPDWWPDSRDTEVTRVPTGRDYLRAKLVVVLAGPVADDISGERYGGYWGWLQSLIDNYVDLDSREHWQPESDYTRAVLLAELCGFDLEEAWVETEGLLRVPAVWAAVERVAAEVLRLHEAGIERGLDRAGFLDAVGGEEQLWPFRTTALGNAFLAAAEAAGMGGSVEPSCE